MIRGGHPGRRGLPAAKGIALAAAFSLAVGCGARSLTVGSVPFPAANAVFTDEDGNAAARLPQAPEPLRLVFLDAPWCPQCGEAWSALGSAAGGFPPGSVRIYRILFDRERLYTSEGSRDAPPFRGAPVPERIPGTPPLEVTTLTALPGPFRKEFRVDRVPLLLLLDGEGTVIRRWVGYSPSLGTSLREEIRRRSVEPPPAGK